MKFTTLKLNTLPFINEKRENLFFLTIRLCLGKHFLNIFWIFPLISLSRKTSPNEFFRTKIIFHFSSNYK